MNIIGLITEYNPFHHGHLYQIRKIKEMYPDSILIMVMSGLFTQRGEVSIINKWDKAKLSLKYGIDIIIELPFVFSCQSADTFAKGAVGILNTLKIDTLIFGSECGDISILNTLADIQINNKEYETIVNTYMKKGLNYPTSLAKALEDLSNIKIEYPNDLLGLSYVKEIKRNNYSINPITIKRTNNYHGNNKDNPIYSASEIRDLIINNKDIAQYVPDGVNKYINKNMFIENYFPYLKYKIITEGILINRYNTVDEGIENRILKYINISTSWNELVMNIKTKRYTYNKINRMLLHILIGFTKSDSKNLNISYLRLLGLSKYGRLYLNKIKKNIEIPIITKYKENIDKNLDIDHKVLMLYSLLLNDDEKNYLFDREYNSKPILE